MSEGKENEIERLIGDLVNEEMGPRLNATRSLPNIALAFGPERSRDELVPFLMGLNFPFPFPFPLLFPFLTFYLLPFTFP